MCSVADKDKIILVPTRNGCTEQQWPLLNVLCFPVRGLVWRRNTMFVWKHNMGWQAALTSAPVELLDGSPCMSRAILSYRVVLCSLHIVSSHAARFVNDE